MRVQSASAEVIDECYQPVLFARHGDQLGSEVHDRAHESLIRDFLRADGLRGGSRGNGRGRRHFWDQIEEDRAEVDQALHAGDGFGGAARGSLLLGPEILRARAYLY